MKLTLTPEQPQGNKCDPTEANRAYAGHKIKALTGKLPEGVSIKADEYCVMFAWYEWPGPAYAVPIGFKQEIPRFQDEFADALKSIQDCWIKHRRKGV